MKLNLLAVNVGNTHTQLGAFVDDALDDVATVPHGDDDACSASFNRLSELILGRPQAMCVIGSVQPETAKRIAAHAKGAWQGDIYRIDKDLPITIGRQLDPEAIVGEDRLLNAAAAYDTLKQACTIVDAGTALTIDFVDGAGTYHGGAILPGTHLMLDALADHTALVPKVTWDRPAEPIGHNTVEAVRSGLFHGLRGAVRELVEGFAEMTGIYPVVVATGGDADMLFRDYPLIERIVPDLTLQGIAVTTRAALSGDDAEADTE